MTKTYDVKCYDLANTFLSDTPHLHTVDLAHALAEIIQQTIEEFIAYEQENYEPPDPPGWEGGFADNH
jgi:putative ribosome biogenesis GTPase RsgA